MSMGSRSLPPPTHYEEIRWQRIRDAGCIACGCETHPVEIHHLLFGGLRVGHLFTIGLCCWCHRGVPREWGTVKDCQRFIGPSLFHQKREFHRAYGSDQVLLDQTNELIDFPPTQIPRRRQRTEAQTLGGNAAHSQDGTLPQRKRRGSKRGTWTARPDKCRIGWTTGGSK